MKELINYKEKKYVIKYKHEREKDEKENILSKGGRTIAFIQKDKDSEILAQAYAVCSLKDTFSKRLGRRISCGRLKKYLSCVPLKV